MLRFIEITSENWDNYKEHILGSETEYPSHIQTSEKDFLLILEEGNLIAKAAYHEGAYVGNYFGYFLGDEDFRDHLIRPRSYKGKRVFYLFSIVMDKGFRGKGFGKAMIKDLISTAVSGGYDIVLGHYRQNSSLALIKGFGAREIERFNDWEGTGEVYVLCELDLQDQNP